MAACENGGVGEMQEAEKQMAGRWAHLIEDPSKAMPPPVYGTSRRMVGPTLRCKAEGKDRK